ncbi:hypothetical protein RJ55_06509 [Drechmeria coniospora]|nr:hypothetical protein RJ55_06509 [Drechmeria coniospora]
MTTNMTLTVVRTTLLLAALAAVSVSQPAPPLPVKSPKRCRSLDCATKPLTFGLDGTFQLSIFEDLHFGENAWDFRGPEKDRKSVRAMDRVLDRESPDLVVLNGDLIAGENAFLENSTVYVDQIVAPLLRRHLPWASAYGNHDHEFNLSAAAILDRERKWPNSRTGSMVAGREAGVSNYFLPVYPPGCSQDGCVPELILWFFDSRGGWYFQERNPAGRRRAQPNWVDATVATWFRQTSAAMAARFGRTIPSLAFVHIPTNASRALQTVNGRASVNPNLQPGTNDDYPLAQQGRDWCSDGRNGPCAYGGQDVPFMQALASTPGLIAVFSGHDHGNTWCYKWDRRVPGMSVAGNGVNLCFGQHSGYGGYGNWPRGARQVRLSREKLRTSLEVDTWIRLESGTVVGSVSLNATYGKDVYPSTK